jgi:hypothetical protein
MPTDGITLANQLFMRCDQRVTPEQCIPFLNKALAKIGAQASWIWDQVSSVGTLPVGNVVSIPTLHMGKKISAFNSSNLLPIVRVEQNDMASSAAGYLNVNGTIYSTFRLGAATSVPFLEFFPALFINPNVDLYYHQQPPTLSISNPAITVRWTVPEMDELLLDMATDDVLRIYRMQRDPNMTADIMMRTKAYAIQFSTERMNTGPAQEVVDAESEKTQIGRT